jgi:hypothetical protein
VGVHIGDGFELLIATFGCFVADEKAIKEVWCNKGAAGFRLCPICYNLCDHKTSAAKAIGQLRSTCTDQSQLKMHTDASVRDVLREAERLHAALEAGEITKGSYVDAIKFFGWNHEPEGILSDTQLQIGAVSTLMHCWVHIYVVTGLFNVEMQYLLVFLKHNDILPSALHAFLQPWTWPRSMSEPRKMFSKKRIDLDGDHYKCDANEALHIYQLVAILLLTIVPANTCVLQILSFLALCDVLDLLANIKHGLVEHARLRDAVLKHLNLFKRAYGLHGWLPKHHLAQHLADQLKRFLFLLTLLTHERKHKVVKRMSRDRFTKQSFELGLMEELTLEHLHQLKHEWCANGLVNPSDPRKAMLIAMRGLYPDAKSFSTARVDIIIYSIYVILHSIL